MSLKDRFWSRVEKAPDCWIWLGTRGHFGHGELVNNGKIERAHRLSWELHNGPIPDGLHVLHKCDNPPCVNPDHLYLGDNTANMRDRDARGRQFNKAKTHCKHGHPLSGDNLYVRSNGHRTCRFCNRRTERRARLSASGRGGESP